MEPETVVIGFGRGSHYRSSHPKYIGNREQNFENRRPLELVRVYNGDRNEFVGTLPVATLRRFSRVADAKFPRTANAPKPAEQSNGPASTANPNPPSGDTIASVGRGKGRGLPSSPSTTLRPIYHDLIVVLDAFYRPSNEAIKEALSWMRTNASNRDKQPLTPFGGPRIANRPLRDVLDLYQASLALGMRPVPRGVKQELLDAIHVEPVSLNTMKIFNEYLPLHDGVNTEMMAAHDRRYFARDYYTQAEVDEFNQYIDLERNIPFKKRLAWVGRENRRKREAAKQASTRKSGTRAERSEGRVAAKGSVTRTVAGPSNTGKKSGGGEVPGRKNL